MSVSGIAKSFRRAKYGSAAALAITSAIVAFPSATSALELSQVTLETDCRAEAIKRIDQKKKPFIIGWDLLCAGEQVKLAKQQESAIDVVDRCVDKLKEFRIASPDKFRALGKITRETACAAASRIPPISPVAADARPSAG